MSYLNLTTAHLGLVHGGTITAIVSAELGGADFLYIGSGADGGLTSLSLTEGSAATVVDTQGSTPATGTYGLEALEVVELGGEHHLLTSGRVDDALAFHKLLSSGDMTQKQSPALPASDIGNITQTLQVDVRSASFILTTQWGQTGFDSFLVTSPTGFTFNGHQDASTGHWQGPQAVIEMETVEITGKDFVVTLAQGQFPVQVTQLLESGTFLKKDTAGPSDGLWVTQPSGLEIVESAGRVFVVVGDAGSSSLSVLRLNKYGDLFWNDQTFDTLDTRFQGVTALETFTVAGNAFVLAGGSDDGISLFQIMPDGQLVHRETRADDFTITLADVSSIHAVTVGTEVQVFVGSGSENGLTQFAFDFDKIGESRAGTNTRDILWGTSKDDVLSGLNGNDIVDGSWGNDYISDGTGYDVLRGGPGADTFVFAPDDRRDVVHDFEDGIDKIDLSAFPLLYDISRMQIYQYDAASTMLIYGDDQLLVKGMNGTPVLVADLGNDDFLF